MQLKLLCEGQEVLAGLVEDQSRLQSKATEKYDETIFEEMRELEDRKKPKEALVLVQKKHILSRCESGRVESEHVAKIGRVESALGTPCPLNRARLPWQVIWKKCPRSLRGR